MLVLSRGVQRKIIIDKGGQIITITVIDVWPPRVKLDMDAPAGSKICHDGKPADRCLTLEEGERLSVDDVIEVVVCEVKNTEARIGVEAPKSITIHRKEVRDSISREGARRVM